MQFKQSPVACATGFFFLIALMALSLCCCSMSLAKSNSSVISKLTNQTIKQTINNNTTIVVSCTRKIKLCELMAMLIMFISVSIQIKLQTQQLLQLKKHLLAALALQGRSYSQKLLVMMLENGSRVYCSHQIYSCFFSLKS